MAILLAMTGERLIDYEVLAQDALRGIVRTVLTGVAKSGLPGQHHFYIAFNTSAPGVGISSRLKGKYPDEMTIVLQHRFWDLVVSDERFEVKLTFDGIPETLVVPFTAIRVFFDPSVPYGLQFEGSDLAPHSGGVEIDTDRALPFGAGVRPPNPEAPPARNEKKPKVSRKRAGKAPAGEETAAKPRALPAPGAEGAASSQALGTRPRLVASKPEQPEAANDTKVVQLDKFRKK